MKRVALYGGSFDPPHLGHAQVLIQVQHAGFDEIWLVPAACHPFGKQSAPFHHRLAMLELAFGNLGSGISINALESERTGVSRTWDTVQELRHRYPEVRFTLVLGEDQKADLHRWHRSDELARLVPFFFAGRGTWDGWPQVPRVPDYSSTDIRAACELGEVPEAFLHADVASYIRGHGLYGLAATAPAVSLGLVGLGRVGGSILHSLALSGMLPAWCADPDPARIAVAQKWNIPVFSSWEDASSAEGTPDVVYFCTPDGYKPADAGGVLPAETVCLHAGGMHRPEDVFGLLKGHEKTGILHPMRNVASSRQDLRGNLFSVTASASCMDTIENLAGVMRLQLFPVQSKKRALFHALCALAANGSQFLERATEDGLRRVAGGDARLARDGIRQLVEHALEAWHRQGDQGLTGPWVRRDDATIRSHVSALREDEAGLAVLYDLFRKEARRVFREPDAGD